MFWCVLQRDPGLNRFEPCWNTGRFSCAEPPSSFCLHRATRGGGLCKKKKKKNLPLLLMSFYSPNLKSAWCKYLVAINGFRSVPQNAFISGIARAKWSHWKSLSLTEGKGMKIRYWVNARPPLWTCSAITKREMQEEMLLSPPCCGYFSEKRRKQSIGFACCTWKLLLLPRFYQWLVCRDCFCRSRSEAETEAGRVVFHFSGWQVDLAEIPFFFFFSFF